MTGPRFILVGGFLGAGKTTLLAQAARRLIARGKRVGLIINDQSTDLVDAAILEQEGFRVGEVTGGCFCCKFDELASLSRNMVDASGADVLLAEPVGSCTDLSATVLQPLKQLYGDSFQLAPFSVVVDPLRAGDLLRPSGRSLFPDGIRYIFRKQLEEADIVVLNKTDLADEPERKELRALLREAAPHAPLLEVSARDGQGVDAWLDRVEQEGPAGGQIPEVDYDTYAEGEAALGWLNARVRLTGTAGTDWQGLGTALVRELQRRLLERRAEVGHVKLHLAAPAGGAAAAGSVQVNLTGLHQEISSRGAIAGPAAEVELLVNARALLDPKALQSAVENCLETISGDSVRVEILRMEAFRPDRPQPVHRYDAVVS